MRIKPLIQLFSVALAVLAASQAGAATSAFTISDTTGQNLANPPFTLGFKFTTTGPIVITQLGLFDDSQDGLVESHALGVFDSLGTLLASTTIQSGTASALLNQFRYETIAALNLAPGTYTVGAVYTSGADALIFPGAANGFAAAPGITFVESAFAAGAVLTAPGSTGGSDPSYFGPNFQFNAVPEPSTFIAGALLGLPLAFAGVRRLRGARH